MTEQIISWSHSKLMDYEKCRFMTKLKHIDRIPEPERPLPPGKTEHANDRGTRIHDNCEQYVRGDIDELAPEAEKHFGVQIDFLRVLYQDGLVSLEGEWAMDQNWGPTGWDGTWEAINATTVQELGLPVKKAAKLPERGDIYTVLRVGKEHHIWVPAWLRLKLDVCVFIDPTHAIVIDYKTGRKFGNEVKHAEQLQLYQLVTFLRYPELEKVTAELWYLDQGVEHTTSQTFTRSQGLRFKQAFDKRGNALTSNTDWRPNPSVMTCKWCQYGPWNGGQCLVGVRAPGKSS